MVSNSKYSLVLASQSPRRKELLGWIDVPFIIQKSDVEEFSNSKDPVVYAEEIAAQKGNDVWNILPNKDDLNPLIVSSDTVVELNGRIYGKPKDTDEAREMLLSLGGKTHNVVTAVFLKAKFGEEVREKAFSVKTEVTFHEIKEDILGPYIESRESMDKAGAYGIQGKGLTFVESLKGSYSNVVGFPLVEFLDELKVFLGLEVSATNWRENFK